MSSALMYAHDKWVYDCVLCNHMYIAQTSNGAYRCAALWLSTIAYAQTLVLLNMHTG